MKDSTNFIDKCSERQNSIDKKLLNEFKKYEKGFTEKSKPAYWNECAGKTTLKEIHNNANIGDKICCPNCSYTSAIQFT